VTITDLPRAGSTLLRSALALTARGWHVFPCAPGGKRPALRGNWQHLATTDPARICRWWARLPYNIGISCGPSGLVIIDLDIAKDSAVGSGAGPACGAESLAYLCARHGQPYPSSTFTVRTPSGGTHLYFQATARKARNSASRLGPLIDTRADGGYVVAPGSRVAGRAYELLSSDPTEPLPDWIADALDEHPAAPPEPRPVPAADTRGGTAYALAALRNECERMATAVDGTRHDTLNKAVFSLGQLVGAGLLPELAVIASLTDAARASGLPDRDIPRIIRSGMEAGIRNPRRCGPN
jgi:hypothetical protein